MSCHLGGRIFLIKTKDFETFEDVGFITGVDHRNCVIFPEKFDGYYVRLERPAGEGKIGDIWMAKSPDLESKSVYIQILLRPDTLRDRY
ncbi:MAG: hypothetical protein DRI44_09880 [Chlamydiae bacterium]|nr:MAG: hypothetical protein DRI44_09880 [Chlamydiota bacterium]